MQATTTTFCLTLLVICAFAINPALASDQENIQGTWSLETVTMDGKTMPRVAVVYVFTGDTLIVRPEAGKEQKATFTLDLSSKPKILVVQRDQHAPDNKPDRSPYELNGDTLRISFVSADEHPTEVSDNGHILFTLKRKKQ
jgi:uncharacterized protein (TIGR03067 family)